MEYISKTLFWVANSLLIPDIIILLILFVRSLMLFGSFYNQYMIKRRNDRNLDNAIKSLSPDNVDDLYKLIPTSDNSLFIKYLRDLLTSSYTEDYANYQISLFENEADKDLSVSRLLAKIGPILGLIGTLIAMSPALVGLSTGDISGMAYNMQVVFATTVIGLVVSATGLLTQQFKQRWSEKDLPLLEYVSRVFRVADISISLESKFVGIGTIGKFAAGNLFIGEFKKVDGTNGILDFGKPFTARPTKLKGYYKYTTAPINYASAQYEAIKGQPDTCAIYLALGDWSEPVEIRTRPSNAKYFDRNDPRIIAYAEFNSGKSITDYTEFELELDYRSTNRVPTYLIVVCSASNYGDFFTGGSGSILYVADFSL